MYCSTDVVKQSWFSKCFAGFVCSCLHKLLLPTVCNCVKKLEPFSVLYLKIPEGELVVDMDSEMSLYHQMDLPTSLKAGLELPVAVPAPVGEEVVITDSGVPTSGAPSPVPTVPGLTHPQILEDQAVEEFMVELPLDEAEDYSMDAQQEAAVGPHHSPVYTMLEPAPGCTSPWSMGASCDSDSLDSGLGASENSSILSKKNSMSRLPSQGIYIFFPDRSDIVSILKPLLQLGKCCYLCLE